MEWKLIFRIVLRMNPKLGAARLLLNVNAAVRSQRLPRHPTPKPTVFPVQHGEDEKLLD
jgi:hypothetical protein